MLGYLKDWYTFWRSLPATTRLAAFAALAAGCITILPHLPPAWQAYTEHRPYYAVAPVANDYWNVYWPRVREILDGHWRVTDTDLWEYRNGPTVPRPQLTPWFAVPFAALFGMRLASLLPEFLFGAASFFLLFLLSARLLNHRLSGLIAASLLFNVRDAIFTVFQWPFVWKDVVKIFLPLAVGVHPLPHANFFTPESHNPGFLIYAPTLLLFFQTLERPRLRNALLLGLFVGLLFYTYLYFWIYLFVVLAMTLVILVVRRQFAAVKALCLAIGVALLVSIPFWHIYFQFQQLATATDFFFRTIGAEEGRFFRWSQLAWYAAYAAGAGYVWFRFQRGRLPVMAAIGFSSLLLAGIAVFNLQLLTGTNWQPVQWHIRILYLPMTLLLVLLAQDGALWIRARWPQTRHWVRAGAVVCCLSFFTASAHWQLTWPRQFDAYRAIPPDVHAALTWLDVQLPTDAVVMSPSPTMNDLLVLFTPAKISMPRGLNTYAGRWEREERLLRTWKVFGIPESQIRERLASTNAPAFPEPDLVDYLYAQFFFPRTPDTFFGTSIPSQLPADTTEALITRYQALPDDPSQLLGPYRTDYLLFGPWEQALGASTSSLASVARPVFSTPSLTIFKLLP